MKLEAKQMPGKMDKGNDDGPKIPAFVTGTQKPANAIGEVGGTLDDVRAIIGGILNGGKAPEGKDITASIFSERFNLNDYRALPANVIELRNPLKTAVLTQLKMCLVKILVFGRVIDSDEKRALTLIKERLEFLRDDCAVNRMQDWVQIIEMDLRNIGAIFDKK